MKVLVLGVDGMIGHKIAQSLKEGYKLFGSTRKHLTNKNLGIENIKIVLHDFLIDKTEHLVSNICPDIIINCVGITTRRGVNASKAKTELINSILPHELDKLSQKYSCKLIHFSTDCVFNGAKGNYTEVSRTDAIDLYGISKAKGEVNSNSSLTLRTSMIGRELYNFTELFEWLYSMREKSVEGYSEVIYSGITTVRMGKIIDKILKNNISLSGLFNISSEPISKYDLLKKLSDSFDLEIDIKKNSNISSNKVLNSKKFTEITGIKAPNWNDLIIEFKEDSYKYKELYKK